MPVRRVSRGGPRKLRRTFWGRAPCRPVRAGTYLHDAISVIGGPVDQPASRPVRRDHQQPRPGHLAAGERAGRLCGICRGCQAFSRPRSTRPCRLILARSPWSPTEPSAPPEPEPHHNRNTSFYSLGLKDFIYISLRQPIDWAPDDAPLSYRAGGFDQQHGSWFRPS